MACVYDSCELAAANELRTAFFDCSKSGSRSVLFSFSLPVVAGTDIVELPIAVFAEENFHNASRRHIWDACHKKTA